MTSTRAGRLLNASAWALLWLLVLVVLVFFVIRVLNDVESLTTGVIPSEGSFDRRYALNPVLAYVHIVPGLVYLLGAPFQLSFRFRDRNIKRHRLIGRIVLPAGLITGVFAIVVGLVMPFGGATEASATVVFGLYFLVSLVLAYRAIKAGVVPVHRRWMIRAYAIGVGVGMIRIVVGVGEAFGVGIASSFGAAFWIAFVVMTILAEVWLLARPLPPGWVEIPV